MFWFAASNFICSEECVILMWRWREGWEEGGRKVGGRLGGRLGVARIESHAFIGQVVPTLCYQ